MVKGLEKEATAKCVFGYFDGKDLELFESSLQGRVADIPSGDKGYGWNSIFIPKAIQLQELKWMKKTTKKLICK